MPHEVKRIERKMLFNQPHLIMAEQFESILEYLDSRPDGMMTKEELAVARDLRERNKREKNLGEGDVAIIRVEGSLTYEETLFSALCGMSSYQGILTQMREAVQEGYKVVVLDVNSGGGQAYGCFSTAKELRNLALENDIKLIAYIDGISASAAYGLSVAADEIIINPYAEVGSIGVLTRLVNDNEKKKKEGITTTYITAGKEKIPFDADGEWREGFLDDLQSKVDSLYNDFVAHVATMRGISEETVRDTEAKMFTREKALELGLADKVMDLPEFFNYLSDLVEGSDNMPLNLFKTKKKEETMSVESQEAEATVDTTKVEAQAEATHESVTQMSAEQLAELEAMRQELAKYKEAEAQAAQLEQEQKRNKLLEQLAGYSFAKDQAEELGAMLFEASEDLRNSVLSVLEKADKAVEEAVSEPLSVEAEAEVVDEKARAKEATRRQIEAKYAVRDK